MSPFWEDKAEARGMSRPRLNTTPIKRPARQIIFPISWYFGWRGLISSPHPKPQGLPSEALLPEPASLQALGCCCDALPALPFVLFGPK